MNLAPSALSLFLFGTVTIMISKRTIVTAAKSTAFLLPSSSFATNTCKKYNHNNKQHTLAAISSHSPSINSLPIIGRRRKLYRHNVSPFSSLSSSQQPSALLHTTASTTSSLSSPALFARGGGGGERGWGRSKSTKASTTTVALNSAVIDDQEIEATTPPTPPEEIFRRDYKPLPWIVSNISMDFDIRDGRTTVISEMTIAINPKSSDNEDNDEDMVLDGEESAIRLLSLSLDGRALIEKEDYYIEPGKLVVKGSSLRMNMESSGGVLRTTAEIIPEDNTQLSGTHFLFFC